MVLADRHHDAAMAGAALRLIETARTVSWDGGDAANAAFYESRLPRAHAILDRLRGE